MFGSYVDYHLLKPLTHRRNYATEDELDRRAKQTGYTLDQASAYLNKVRTEYFRDELPIDPDLAYLDVGCGMGRLSIGLSLLGAKDVTGVDIVERHIIEARQVAAKIPAGMARPEFHVADIHRWEANRRFDVVFVLGAMEHIHSPGEFLKSLARFLKPTGRAFVSIEPFHSPFGDHMSGFFRVQIPWRGLLFSEKAILRLRRECFRSSDKAERFQDVAGGLNRMSFSTYLEKIRLAGFEVVRHNCNPQFWTHKRYFLVRPFSWVLTRIPRLRDFFIVTAYSILRLRSEGPVRSTPGLPA